MNQVVANLLAGLAIIGGILATLLTLVFLAASAPNSSDVQLRTLKIFGMSAAGVGALCAVAAIALMITARPGWAASIGALPIALAAIAFILALVFSG